MILLALDTTTEACSAALWIDGLVRQRYQLAPRQHGELILAMVDDLLAEAGVARAGIDAIAFARGPGAFTGVRIGVAAAQAMGLALDRPLLPISSLAALAYGAWRERATAAVLVAVDARMGQIYAGAYRCREGEAQLVGQEQVITPSAWRPPGGSWHAVGSGWRVYADTLDAWPDVSIQSQDGERLPQAQDLVRLALAPYQAQLGVAAEFALPVYLRDQVANKPNRR